MLAVLGDACQETAHGAAASTRHGFAQHAAVTTPGIAQQRVVDAIAVDER
jgi:hypothetical protein